MQYNIIMRKGSFSTSNQLTCIDILTVFLFAVLSYVLYYNTLQGEFLFDDLRLILHNPQIKIPDLSFGSLINSASTTRPVAMLSFALNYYFHGDNVTGYHIVNIIIHFFSGIFLYFFIKTTLQLPSVHERYQNMVWLPFVTASLWLVNPIHTQSVSYIIQRMNSLSAMFYILAMMLYSKARTSISQTRQYLLLTLCVISFFLALGSKEIAATLPFFVFLYEWYFFQNLKKKWLKNFLIWGGIFCLLLLILYVTLPAFFPTGIISSGYRVYDFTLTQRVLTEFRVVLLYVGLIFFPHPSRLNLDYDFSLSYSLLDPSTTLIAVTLCLAGFFLAVFLAKREKLISFCILWFTGNLVIESSVIPLDLVFEHRTYLPSMLLILLSVALASRTISQKSIKVCIFIFLVACSSTWTIQRNNVWKNALNLLIDTAQKSPEKARPFYNVACEYAKKNDAEGTIFWLRQSISKDDFNRWDLIKNDRDLDKIRNSVEFKQFLEDTVPPKYRSFFDHYE
jgi:protein O-mannosyl-transferase